MKKRASFFRAFTFIEIVVSITILSILATIAFISLTWYGKQSRDTKRVSDVESIEKVLDLYNIDTSKYPDPTNSVSITYSGATVWTQWDFGTGTMIQTWKIYGDLLDPLYNVPYTYSVTDSKREYQLSYALEWPLLLGNNSDANFQLWGQAYAASPFTPDELHPIIWLDATDIDADGNTWNNPSDGASFSVWKNKSSVWSANDPTVTDGSLKYTVNGYNDNKVGVFIKDDVGLKLNNSDITSGDIFYVVENKDPFGKTDKKGTGLQSTSSNNMHIGYYDKYRDSLRIGSAPKHSTSNPATKNGRKKPFIYGFHTDNSNYEFYDNGWLISQWSTNSITGIEWGFNKAWYDGSKADFVVSEILIFDSKLTESERQKVEWYLAWKWLEWDDLPEDHPYKDAPPESSWPPASPDTTPDAFTFSDVTDATLSTEYTSNSFTVSGINTGTSISVSGAGTYSVNNGAFTSVSGTVNNGDTISVKQTSSASSSTGVSTTLTIGGVSDTYTVTTLVADTTPDSFTLNDISDATLSTVYTSNSITVSGINTGVPISISGGDATYRIGSGVPSDATWWGTATASSTYSLSSAEWAFDNQTSTSGWANNGSLPAQLQYDFGAGDPQIITKYTLYRSEDQSWGWSDDDYSPGKWRFEGSNNASDWTVLDSQDHEEIKSDHTKKQYTFSNTNYYRYYRINILKAEDDDEKWVNITEMELISDNTGVFTSASGTVNNGDVVSVRMTSASSAATWQTAVLTIGGVSENYILTTEGADTVPGTFSFTDVSDASLSTQYTSNSITVSNINSASPISISWWWQYSINAWPYTSTSGTVNNGDTVTIRQTSSSSNSSTVGSILNIGWVTATYNITTPAPPVDTTPDSFSFTDISNVSLNTLYTSNSITVSWINSGSPISITGWTYDINGTKTYVSTSGTVNNGDVITVRQTSSSSSSTSVNTTLTIGGISDTYTTTTLVVDTTPDPFPLTYVTDAILNKTYESNTITVSGINSPTVIDISWWGGKYKVNGWDWQSWSGTVVAWDEVIVKLQSLASGNSQVSTTLDIGGVTSDFNITTIADDTTPDSFILVDKVDAEVSTTYTSDAITISGINSGADISISGWWTYSINGNTYTSTPGTVYNNDVVRVRQKSSSSYTDSVNTILTIGWVSDTYTITTAVENTPSSVTSTQDKSKVYVRWNYNGLFTHGSFSGSHYVFATPSIIASDLTNTDFLSIVWSKKFVYEWYNNYPATYTSSDNSLTSSGWFDNLRLSGPVIFEGTRDELASYSWIKEIDNAIRSTYGNSPIYEDISGYLDSYGTTYVENILWSLVWINPIKPYYCSDILDKKLTSNIAPNATITATSNTQWGGVSWTGWIANGVKLIEGNLNYEYHSDTINAKIEFNWDTPQSVWFIRIYNRTWTYSSRLSWAIISLYDTTNKLLYSHTLWDTTGDYVVDLDLEWIGELYDTVWKVTIESQWPDSYLNLREVEIYVWWNLKDGFYLVDSDGAGGQKPYQVYCDMTTDGGWWTKIGGNMIDREDFSGANHISLYPGGTVNYNRENNIISMQSPVSSGYVMEQKWLVWGGDSSLVDYDLIFTDLSAFKVWRELRISAWVADAWDEWDSTNGGKGYIFKNTLTYTDGTTSIDGDRVTLEEKTVNGVLWKHQMVRIPIEKEVSGFKWEVWKWAESSASRVLYFTWLGAEIFYK